MRRIALADIHLTAYKDDKLEDDGLPYRLSILIKVIRSVCMIARREKIKNIDILGDLFNDKNLAYTDSLNSFKNILKEFNDLEFLILSGNHDISSTGENQSSLVSVFEGYENVTPLTETMKIGDSILAVPWSKTMVNDIKTGSAPILLSHLGLSEAVLQSGISMVTNVKMSDMKAFKLVLLGHYHKPQELSNDFTKLWYIGNPIHTNWNDKNEQKRFLIYDTETLEVQSIPIRGFKEYRELIIENIESAKDILLEADDLKSKGHKVRVRKLCKEQLETSEDMVVIEESVVDPTNRGITVSMTTDEKIKKYMDIKEISKDDYDEFLKMGQCFISEALLNKK